MLGNISDLHLADGTTGKSIPGHAFEIFRERLEDMAFSASWRTDGVYRPIEEFTVVLLGDIFDIIRSTKWTEEQLGQPGCARPWSPLENPSHIRKIEQISQAIIQKNSEGLEVLREMAEGICIKIPEAVESQPNYRRVRDFRFRKLRGVKANIYYMVGNHDWALGCEGQAYDAIRQKISQSMGLANDPGPFPHVAAPGTMLAQVFAAHKVYARHGDIYDPINMPPSLNRSEASLGDVLVVELFNELPARIRRELSDMLPPSFFESLDEMGSIRPMLLTPVWIAYLMDHYHVSPFCRKKIDEIWHSLLERFSRLDILDAFNQPFKPDLVDLLKNIQILKGISLGRLDRVSRFFEKKFSGLLTHKGQNYERKADLENPPWASRFIVYGHTHAFSVYPLRANNPTNNQVERIYMNSGTWKPLYEIAYMDKQGFISHKTMSYLGFYSGDERSGRSFETWSGTLDL